MPTSVRVRRGGELVATGAAKSSSSKPSQLTQPKLNQAEIQELEQQVGQLHRGIVTNSYRIGEILVRLREEAIAPGNWRRYMEGAQERFGFSIRTGFRYIEGYEKAVSLPVSKVRALESIGLDPAKPRVLAAIDSVASEGRGQMKPAVFAKAVQEQVKEQRKGTVTSIEAGDGYRQKRRQTKLLEFAERLYDGVDNPTVIEREFDAVKERLVRALTQAMKSRLAGQARKAA